MKQLDGNKRLECVEICKDKVSKLADTYKHLDWVIPINNSSIPIEAMKNVSFVSVWNSKYNHIRINKLYSEGIVNTWFHMDMDTMKNFTGYLPTNFSYDAVLIDGSEFTGYQEYEMIKDDVSLLFLDDVHRVYKCRQIYEELINNSKWIKLEENPTCRNGYVIFKRNDNEI
jgi:hypothetical protein